MAEERAHDVVVEYPEGLRYAAYRCVVCDQSGFSPPALPCPGPPEGQTFYSVDIVVTNLASGERSQFKAGRVRYSTDAKPLVDEPLEIGEIRDYYARMPHSVRAFDFVIRGRALMADGELFQVRSEGVIDRDVDEPVGGPVTALGYGRCGECDQMIHVRADGRLRKHGPHVRRCPGSGTLPS